MKTNELTLKGGHQARFLKHAIEDWKSLSNTSARSAGNLMCSAL
jgi:hypothetical protein